MNADLFKAEIRQQINQAIARMSSDGVVGVSRDCLWQHLRLSPTNGPVGTNAAWVAKQMYLEIVSKPPFNRFVYA